ncbi:MAG: hypothetical protein COZ06_08835 [Armatimonadetes bacterium CG_4_10_14_3_um_filter_66_18]|nr:hypothetical protein [Armatimonadota bacterium]OIO98513.1 MAG: hypothetical protein AUJ96_21115 [Armatimonadetes bacterium CG2_30_66_41]PIU94861.1 MAG: hypothetical protein COS65_05455 [Armatimonadetes bacterium CG06_land_8_20_14_3_00_66_21]PIX46713.1 MAG: hypothetical protein COZ57_10600 [Armatimonadetes bacterium CG_4_8_14_3_um_filter_66_20]PIY50527.1 MAG: hypothetical protein COZ06_08835 [Armatimonadetes bacterium CG_4_10_14_3_um_filter_66_18]PIZ40862.1 MAG: hypothetical protein COY42_20
MNPQHAVLFQPLPIRTHELRNRLVCPPMVTCRDVVGPEGLKWYRTIAAGGVGCVIVEAMRVHLFGTDFTAANMRGLADAITTEGALPVVQLFLAQTEGLAEPADFSLADLDRVVEQFVTAARVCEEAGFAGVEPHGAHGFLLNRFFSPVANSRTDDYGGQALEGRMKLGLRIVSTLRERLSDETLLFYRHTPRLGEDYPLDDSLQFARRLQAAGLDVLDLSPAGIDEPAELAAPFASELTIPVIAVNNMCQHDRAVTALEQGRADLVAIGRGLIADPEWPRKTQAGRLDEILFCTECDEACFGNLRRGEPIGCVLHD